ncbi:hydroxyphenylacetyl-CoA thioesterase PaaI [Pseudoflavitalea sp. X16]|uniref:hydroxyphenylacetyl-CoA thioesterase PaaI n=1 Tax=Paraflavitalea devenefica TaxID=2716334 RepID=UPI001420110F|nr:hydroxyphenylacetyl-CoA thioesterase PaaI [Paraflavitalea devenefica]NII24296.1 hydroxyphenylacetyl-CoA thioesterase PaaI [Paraflavitalea devenefica]
MQADQLAVQVVNKMMEHDAFSQWLGIQVIKVREGYSKLQMTLREEMLNGFGVIHGGIAFSLADSAFAFACNNRNNLSMALDVSITFTKAGQPGDIFTAEAREIHNGRSTGLYLIEVTNQNNQPVAIFKGTCFRTGRELVTVEAETGEV